MVGLVAVEHVVGGNQDRVLHRDAGLGRAAAGFDPAVPRGQVGVLRAGRGTGRFVEVEP